MNNTELNVNSDSEDEIFFGAVRSPERRKANRLGNRKTQVFEAPLFDQPLSSSMAPRDDVPKTYSKVPPRKRTTESERAQAIKHRPPPLPPFTQLYCSKEGQSLNSPFHQLTDTKNQTNNHRNYRSTRPILPLPSPHIHSMPLTSRHLLSVPSQQHRRFCLSPGLSPSFFNEPFDKLLQYNGYASRTENSSPFNISCSSIEDVMSPAGLLFCSPILPITQHKVSKKIKKKNYQIEHINKTIISPSDSEESNGGCTPNEFISNVQKNVDDIRKTPDLFYTSSWITRRHDYKKIHLTTEIDNSFGMDSSMGKARLHRSSSVPEVHIIHPEESDNSFISIRSNSGVSSRIDILSHELEDTKTENGTVSDSMQMPWLLNMASALNHTLSFSDSESTNAQSPLFSDLNKTLYSVSTLTPIFTPTFSKYIS